MALFKQTQKYWEKWEPINGLNGEYNMDNNEIELGSDKVEILLKLPLLLHAINDSLLKIKLCKNIESANIYFDSLQEAQSCISKLIFKKNIEVAESLWKFFKDFDRIDDADERVYMFDMIKNKQYFL